MALRGDQKAELPDLPQRVADRIEKYVKVSFATAELDPRELADDELTLFNLPPRPDRKAAPHAYRNWQRAMTPPLNLPREPERIADLFAILPKQTRLARFGNARSLGESSRNWSGAYVRANPTQHICLAQGTWTVTETRAPKGVNEYAVSTWVGLDGHHPASRSMPQLGIQRASLSNPADEWLLAWWQWWVKPDPEGLQVVIRCMPVAAQDEIYAQVQEIGPAKVSFFMRNMTQNKSFAFAYELPNPWGPLPSPVHLAVEGRTAEWIVERPLVPRHAPRLGDFGQTLFTDCCAATGSGLGGPLTDIALDGSRLIKLNEWDNHACPGRLASSALQEGPDSFAMTFVA